MMNKYDMFLILMFTLLVSIGIGLAETSVEATGTSVQLEATGTAIQLEEAGYEIGDLGTINERYEEEENMYKEYIYMTESNGNYKAVNPDTGAVGLCQMNPNYHTLKEEYYVDESVQDQVCTQYMLERYGSWENAYNFHISNGWW